MARYDDVSRLAFFGGLLWMSGFIFLTSRSWETKTLLGTAIDRLP